MLAAPPLRIYLSRAFAVVCLKAVRSKVLQTQACHSLFTALLYVPMYRTLLRQVVSHDLAFIAF